MTGDDIHVTGAAALRDLGRRFRAAGEGGKQLRREMLAAIRTEVKVLGAEMSAHAGKVLPQRGGFAARAAKVPITARTRLSGRKAGVRMVVEDKKGGMDLRRIDGGRLRHPVFGNRHRWVTQEIKPGAFTEPFEAAADDLRSTLQRIFTEYGEKLQ